MSYARDKRIADDVGAGAEPKPCLTCSASTPHDTLSTYGSRCYACYRAYCAEVQPAVSIGRYETPKRLRELSLNRAGIGWAYALRSREEAGDRLTAYQREAWREVLKRRDEPAELSEAA